MTILAFEKKTEVTGSQIWPVRVITERVHAMFCQKEACTRAVEWAGALVQIR